ncbi:hypothetical protein P676_1256 [Acinetobacter baumannii UH7607]|nr:hypothetical protein P662_3591 [Acinetobacter baumannii UH22908]ETR08079.1 hypothetical protein P676_1256 [Acinetobacter baumannii UH7607]
MGNVFRLNLASGVAITAWEIVKGIRKESFSHHQKVESIETCH